ncbi:calmodulin-lysine N-methyltransferase-like [Mytilus californianus]|uniref:calmodulin-lysine N-methyltransferase-like n=1 Tax=Mytilus californianus TaxID=6549 RepID=UPI00224831A6|nr:calmodulin-lysine N-methyltransferase-like [Mytilus californianus]
MNRKERARQRWQILKEALSGRQSSDTCKHSVSVRRFSGYGLLNTTVQEVEGFKGAVWYRYTCPYQQDLQMNIRHLPGTINADTLLGFNNTGNVCVWPSEEIMAYYCMKNIEQFKNCNVCELGGGMTCLAGIAMCMLSEANHILVTDGNEDSVLNLSKIIQDKENKVSFKVEDCETRVLRWGDGELEQDLTNKFDFVLCADCLFFEEGREDLIKKVFNLLKDEGTSLMFAPKRGTTFDDFVSLAKSVFNVEVMENYDDTIWDLHCKLKTDANGLYDENIHYPLFMKLTKKQS